MSGPGQNLADGRSIELATTGERTGPSAERVCGFCRNGPVGDAATWLDGVPREPAPCPRCGMKYAKEKYRTIIADPPWNVKRPTGWNSNENHRSQPYPVMSVDEIAALPVAGLADDVSFLFLWTVNAYVEAAYEVARRWGFRPVTLLTWCKEPRGVGPGGYFTTTTEFILHARRGSLSSGRTRAVETSWFVWPRGRQSEKPAAFMDLVEEHFPAPRLEMFARRQRLGWDTWGNEALEHVELAS